MNGLNWFDEACHDSCRASDYARTTRVESFDIVSIAAGRQRPADIARNLGVSRQAISQILKAFAPRGWIETLPDPNNGQAHIVTFSAAISKRADLGGHLIHGIVHELQQRLGSAHQNTQQLHTTQDWAMRPRAQTP